MKRRLGNVCASSTTCNALEYHANTSPKPKKTERKYHQARTFFPKVIYSQMSILVSKAPFQPLLLTEMFYEHFK